MPKSILLALLIPMAMASAPVAAGPTGPAAGKTETSTPEGRVGERAQARWEALIAGHIKEAYAYLSPLYRKTMPYEQYRYTVHGVGLWSGARVLGVQCRPGQCQARVEVKARFRMRHIPTPRTAKDVVTETWVYDSGAGDWFLAPRS